jgi:TPR repeat protein
LGGGLHSLRLALACVIKIDTLMRILSDLPVLFTALYMVASLHAQAESDQIKVMRAEAERGDAIAQFGLGMLYEVGRGVPKDFVEAVKWYRKSAVQGYANAQSNLGSQYHKGEGVPKDFVEAVKWFRKAAEQGDFNAQVWLGHAYAKSEGVPMDSVEAYAWYNIAAGSRSDYIFGGYAKKNRDTMEKQMTPAQIHQAQERSKVLTKMIEEKMAKAAGK